MSTRVGVVSEPEGVFELVSDDVPGHWLRRYCNEVPRTLSKGLSERHDPLH